MFADVESVLFAKGLRSTDTGTIGYSRTVPGLQTEIYAGRYLAKSRVLMKFQPRLLLIPMGVIGFCFVFFQLERRPGAFANSTTLGAILVLEIVIACVWRFERTFFPAIMACFLLPATALPGAAESFTVRWLFLGVGALFGLVIWMRSNREKHFGVFHLIALFCTISALASASASASPGTGTLKAASLFLLLLYASTGGRVALAGRERAFVRGLMRACEVLVFFTFATYLVGYHVFGNPNNLGATIAVVPAPVLLWGAMTAEDRRERRRRSVAVALCGILLYFTVCRAAIVADAVVVVALMLSLRRPGILVKAAFAGALLLEIMAVANPSQVDAVVDSMTGRFLYKVSGQSNGVFGSRRGPWDQTIAAVKKHPWFGTGFGTSDLGSDRVGIQGSSIYTKEGSNREHGSSYLAITEYMGMLGILPFLFLLAMVVRATVQVFSWIRGTGSVAHYAVPFALIATAGLVHAAFEDWLFAAGSYLCLFFWVSAFLLIDLASPATTAARARSSEVPPLLAAAAFRSSTTSA